MEMTICEAVEGSFGSCGYVNDQSAADICHATR